MEKTLITFTDGTSEEYDWEGELSIQMIIDAGLYDENDGSWTKEPQTVEIGTKITRIGDEVFLDCSNLTSVTIPDSIKSIGESSFAYCGLTSITIPNSVTSIDGDTFFDCPITELNIPDSVINIGYSSFSGTQVKNVVIGRNVSSIGDAAFMYCQPTSVIFKGKTLEQVQNIEDGNGNKYYPWGIPNPTDVITVA